MGNRQKLEHDRTTVEARAKLEKENLPLPPKPKGDLPMIPRNLSELPDDELMSLFVLFTRWASYLAVQVAMAEIDEEAAQTLVAKAEALVMLGAESASDARVTIRRAKREVDPEVLVHREHHARARAYRKLLQVFFENCERNAQLLSRELTRRTSMASKERRADRYHP